MGLFLFIVVFWLIWIIPSKKDKKNTYDITDGRAYAAGLKIRRVIGVTGDSVIVDFDGDGPPELRDNIKMRVKGLNMPTGTGQDAVWARDNVSRMMFSALSRPDAMIEALALSRDENGVLCGDLLIDGKSLVLMLNLSPFYAETKQPAKPKPPEIQYVPVYPGGQPINGTAQPRYYVNRPGGIDPLSGLQLKSDGHGGFYYE